MYKYQLCIVDHHYESIGTPFPAERLDEAISIVLKKYFTGYSPEIDKRESYAYLSIAIPGRHEIAYLLERTGLIVKDGETNGLPHKMLVI